MKRHVRLVGVPGMSFGMPVGMLVGVLLLTSYAAAVDLQCAAYSTLNQQILVQFNQTSSDFVVCTQENVYVMLPKFTVAFYGTVPETPTEEPTAETPLAERMAQEEEVEDLQLAQSGDTISVEYGFFARGYSTNESDLLPFEELDSGIRTPPYGSQVLPSVSLLCAKPAEPYGQLAFKVTTPDPNVRYMTIMFYEGLMNSAGIQPTFSFDFDEVRLVGAYTLYFENNDVSASTDVRTIPFVISASVSAFSSFSSSPNFEYRLIRDNVSCTDVIYSDILEPIPFVSFDSEFEKAEISSSIDVADNVANATVILAIYPTQSNVTGYSSVLVRGQINDVKPENTADCFPAGATVERLVHGDSSSSEVVRMDQVRIGDYLKVSKNQFSPVFMLGHDDARSKISYLRINVASSQAELSSVLISMNHLIYVCHQNDPCKLMAAKDVMVGDSLEHSESKQRWQVVSVRMEMTRGRYNPHTLHGDLVVNGFQASCYTSLVHPQLAAAMLVVFRFLYQAISSRLVLSPQHLSALYERVCHVGIQSSIGF